MRLPKPFYKLALRFDVERLRAEVAALPAEVWVEHPSAIEGNSAARLITADGMENDAVHGTMLPTAHLQRLPYIRQILASFGVVWSRSRLMRLAPRAAVPEHADINYHWFKRVRLHIPIVTRPTVRFQCGNQSVHMAAGEAWLFDNWRLHGVENPSDEERIHLVADTTGSSAFWQFVAQSDLPNVPVRQLPYDPNRDAAPMTERAHLPLVMPPAEVDLLIGDFRGELTTIQDSTQTAGAPGSALARYHHLLDAFSRDWRQLYLLHGESAEGMSAYAKLCDHVREVSRQLAEGLVMRTNEVAAHTVLQGRLLQHLLHSPSKSAASPRARSTAPGHERLPAPVFIVAAPRSGSTLLFETLAVNRQFSTLGGEAHWLVEEIPQLQPIAPDVGSNRLVASHATEAVSRQIVQTVLSEAQSAAGGAPTDRLRLLEKTPKNALRIPFLNRVFPDARFIFLWREPHENLSSIIEAWRSNNWVTYRGLPGWNGPWSLLLPPGWQCLAGKPLEEIAAYQWESTNRIVMDDLQWLPEERWTAVNYADFLADPKATVQRLCRFAAVEFDAASAARVAAPLPLSRYTQTPPERDKWRRNEAIVQRAMPAVEATWERLKRLQS